jgi:hypothetical protein
MNVDGSKGARKSPYSNFIFRNIPVTPLAQAMKYSLIHPFTTPHSADFLFEDVAVKSALRDIQQGWRKTVTDLQSLGWAEMSGAGWRVAVNCPPIFSICPTKSNRRCHKYLICPFCWANQIAAETFLRLEFDLYGTTRSLRLTASEELSSKVEPLSVDIVEVIRTDLVSKDRTAAELVQTAHAGRSAFRDTFVNMRGALSLSTLEPAAVGWKLIRRLLIVVPKDFSDAAIPQEDDNIRVRRHREELTREKLAAIVGRVCAYPVGLLRGDVDRVREILQARKGSRKNANNNLRGTSPKLMGFYGKLRNKQERESRYQPVDT